eukprot:2761965-Rhodomonas_salina.1
MIKLQCSVESIRGSLPVETQTLKPIDSVSNSTIISAVLLYDCMPRTATPILWSTELTAQARDRTQCQYPFVGGRLRRRRGGPGDWERNLKREEQVFCDGRKGGEDLRRELPVTCSDAHYISGVHTTSPDAAVGAVV